MAHRLRIGLPLVILFLMTGNGFLSVFAESPTSLDVLITYPDQDYTFGSTATVSMHVLSGGTSIDPDKIEVDVGRSSHLVHVERDGIGLYHASFVIEREEIEDQHFGIDAYVWNDGDWAGDAASIFVSDYPYLNVALAIDNQDDVTPIPGQLVEFTVKTTCLGAPVDPDAGTLRAYASMDAGDMALELTRQSIGVYRGVFRIPGDLELYGECRLIARANLTTGRFVSEESGGASIFIRTLDVWYRCIDVGSTHASLEFHAIDISGSPLEGATLSLISAYSRTDKVDTRVWHNLTCDASGQARMELSYSNVSSREPEAPYVSFGGNASYRGLNQSIMGFFMVPGASVLKGEGRSRFEVELLDNYILSMGVEKNLSYIATFDDAPLAGVEMFGCIYADHGVYWHGNITTDANGKFDIEMTTPVTRRAAEGTEQLDARFGARVDGTLYYAWGEPSPIVRSHNNTWESKAERCPMTYFQVTAGPGDREFQLSLCSEGADGTDETALVLWGIGSADENLRGNFRNFTCMDIICDYTGAGVPLVATWSDGAYRSTLKVPDFVPPGANLYAIGIITMSGEPLWEGQVAYLSNISALLVDLPPSVSIGSPANGSVLRGEIITSGTATDDHAVRAVMVRIDGGNWTVATGMSSWSYVIDVGPLDDGHHTIEAISYDGLMHSPISKVDFEYTHAVRTEEANWSVFILIILIMVVLCIILMYRVFKEHQSP